MFRNSGHGNGKDNIEGPSGTRRGYSQTDCHRITRWKRFTSL